MKATLRNLPAGLAVAACLLTAPANRVMAQAIPLSTTVYVQNFDSLASSGTSSVMPYGWYFHETGANANTTYVADNGSNVIGNTYSYGLTGSSDRALGTLHDTSCTSSIGARFVNNSATTIPYVAISYTGEEWRLGTANRQDALIFQWSTNAVDLSDANATWNFCLPLSFFTANTNGAPVGAQNGNTNLNNNILTENLPVNLPPGATLWIRWVDYSASSNDDGLAIDNFSINRTIGPLPVKLASFKAYLNQQQHTELNWEVPSNHDVNQFVVERSYNAESFESIGELSAEKSSATVRYSFTDATASGNVVFYRLKMRNDDGTLAYTGLIRLSRDQKQAQLTLYPNPVTGSSVQLSHPAATEGAQVRIVTLDGRTLMSQDVAEGSMNSAIGVADLPAGYYFLIFTDRNGSTPVRFLK